MEKSLISVKTRPGFMTNLFPSPTCEFNIEAYMTCESSMQLAGLETFTANVYVDNSSTPITTLEYLSTDILTVDSWKMSFDSFNVSNTITSLTLTFEVPYDPVFKLDCVTVRSEEVTGVGCGSRVHLKDLDLLDPGSSYAIDPCTLDLTWGTFSGAATCSDANVYAIQSTYGGETYTIVWSDDLLLTTEDTTYVQLLFGTTNLSFVGIANDGQAYWNTQEVQNNAVLAFGGRGLSECCEWLYKLFNFEASSLYMAGGGPDGDILNITYNDGDDDVVMVEVDSGTDSFMGFAPGTYGFSRGTTGIVSPVTNRQLVMLTADGGDLYYVLFEDYLPISKTLITDDPTSEIVPGFTTGDPTYLSGGGKYVVMYHHDTESYYWYSRVGSALTFMDSATAEYGNISVVDPVVLDDFCLIGDPVPLECEYAFTDLIDIGESEFWSPVGDTYRLGSGWASPSGNIDVVSTRCMPATSNANNVTGFAWWVIDNGDATNWVLSDEYDTELSGSLLIGDIQGDGHRWLEFEMDFSGFSGQLRFTAVTSNDVEIAFSPRVLIVD
jgi:hypothetical protein